MGYDLNGTLMLLTLKLLPLWVILYHFAELSWPFEEEFNKISFEFKPDMQFDISIYTWCKKQHLDYNDTCIMKHQSATYSTGHTGNLTKNVSSLPCTTVLKYVKNVCLFFQVYFEILFI